MVPPVAFRHPDHLVGGLQKLAMIVEGIIDKSLARVVDQSGDFSALGIDGHDPHRAVSSLVVVEREPTRVLVPAMRTDAPWVGEKRLVEGNLLLPGDVEQMRHGLGNLVTRFEITVRMQLRLQLVLGRGLDEMNDVLLSLLMTETNHFPPVGRPSKIALISIAFLPVCRQGYFLAITAETKPDIVVLDKGLDLLCFGRLRKLHFGAGRLLVGQSHCGLRLRGLREEQRRGLLPRSGNSSDDRHLLGPGRIFAERLILKIDFPRFAYCFEVDGLFEQPLLIAIHFLIFDRVKGQLMSLEGLAGCFREILCQPPVVESRFSFTHGCVDENEALPAVS